MDKFIKKLRTNSRIIVSSISFTRVNISFIWLLVTNSSVILSLEITEEKKKEFQNEENKISFVLLSARESRS